MSLCVWVSVCVFMCLVFVANFSSIFTGFFLILMGTKLGPNEPGVTLSMEMSIVVG